MRLTLRTLLAYLDGILEPDDQEDIAQQVKDTEVATQLIHRTRDVVRRMRLEAPELIDIGVCRDPNSVAEYLDNTLAPEQLQEFELICLESDVHLAEVGSCHHILTMILGEPATVDPASRERMYRLGGERPDLAAEAAPGQPTADDAQAKQDRAKPEVPEYLRDGRGSPLRSLAVVGLVAAALVGVAMMFFPDLFKSQDTEESSQVAQGSTGDKNSTPQADGDTQDKVDAAAAATSTTGKPEGDTNPLNAGEPAEAPDAAGDPASGNGDNGESAAKDSVESAVDGSTIDDATADVTVDVNGDVNGVTGEPAATEPTVPEAADVSPVDVPAVVPEASPVDVPSDEGNKAAENVADTDTPADANAEDLDLTDDADLVDESQPVAAPQPVTFGKLLSEDQVCLRWSEAPTDAEAAGDASPEGQWNRLARQASLRLGDKLLALPTYRPMIVVGGTTIELDGGTLVELTDIDAEGIREITVHYGRLVVLSFGNPNAKIRLALNRHRGVATLSDAESTLAVELRPYRERGSNPAEVTSYAAIDLYGASGQVTWEEDGEVTPLVGPAHLALSVHPDNPTGASDKIPAWVESVQLSPLDRRVSPQLAKRLRPDGIKLSLAERAGDARPEVRSLAIRCCAHIGYYDPLIAALDDEEFRANWSTFTGELRDAFDRDQAQGEEILRVLTRTQGDAAARLYRMLWGYSDEQLLAGEAKKLVQSLEDDRLIIRVVGFWNLEDIKKARYNYRPEYNESKRRQSVSRWRKELKANSIVRSKNRNRRAAPKPPASNPQPPKESATPADESADAGGDS